MLNKKRARKVGANDGFFSYNEITGLVMCQWLNFFFSQNIRVDKVPMAEISSMLIESRVGENFWVGKVLMDHAHMVTNCTGLDAYA